MQRIHPVAFGKASAAMIDAACHSLGDAAGVGLAIVRAGSPRPRSAVEVVESDHPLPTRRSRRAGERLLGFISDLPPADPVLYLVSGGGSSLVEVPADGLALSDLVRTERALLGSGVPIQGFNTVRRHLSRVKGGALAVATRPRPFATLAISDVVGDTAEDIASGPTVGDPTSFADALAVLTTNRVEVPDPVRGRLAEGARGRLPENPRPGDRRLSDGSFHLIATNRIAIAASAREARRRGYRTRVLGSDLVGESHLAGEEFARQVREAAPGHRGCCLISGGETTVTLTGKPGRGGRNQEFVLAGAAVLRDSPGTCVLSIGTDGIDGPTDAAGGWSDGRTELRAAARGIDLARALREHDSYGALRSLGELVITGPTGTNVMDLHIGLSVHRAGRAGNSPPRVARSSPRRRS